MTIRTWWEDGASCSDDTVDPETFFEYENAVDTHRTVDVLVVADALALCARCPVSVVCLEVGTTTGSLGIWGGTLAVERGLRYQLARPGEPG